MRRPALRLLPALLLLAIPGGARAQTTGGCTLGNATTDLDVGGVRARLYNTGGLFWKGAGNVYNVPRSLAGNPVPNAVFAQALWIGGYVGSELRGAVATYANWEFYPGPLDTQAQVPGGDCAPYDRIWNVTAAQLRDLDRIGVAARDIVEWPYGLGAPVIDGDGVPGNYNLAGGDRPEILGHQSAFWVMNDAGGPHLRTGSKPLGLEVRVTAHAFRSPSDALHYSTVYRYTLVNRGPGPITQTYLGLFSDPDLGNGPDDYMGSDSTLRMGYVYNADNFDEGTGGYGAAPPALGYRLLEGPAVVDADLDGQPDTPGFTSAVPYDDFYCPNCDPFPTVIDFYRTMQGLWRGGRPHVACGNGLPGPAGCSATRWIFSGDPTAPAGQRFWSEYEPTPGATAPLAAGDRRLVMGSGPFTLQPDVPVTFTLAMVWARGADHLDSVTRLKAAAREVQAVYDATGFRNLPERPYPAVPQARPPIVGPADGAAGQPSNLLLTWEPVPDADAYEVQLTGLDTPSGSATVRVVEPSLRLPYHSTTEGITVPVLPAGRYTWRVRGVNDGGGGAWSDVYTFTVGAGPVRPVSYETFWVTHNAAGPLDPPEFGALDPNHRGFPRFGVPTDDATVGRVQSTNNAVWGLHTADTDASDGGFDSFVSRTTRDGANLAAIGQNDYELRFTAAGGKALEYFDGGTPVLYNVPFELWNVGTKADASDDVRMIPLMNPITGGVRGVFDIGADHPTSGGNNDPQTDWIYWYMPHDTTPGTAGYDAWVAQAQAGDGFGSAVGAEVFARIVLVNFNGGTQFTGPFNATMPETGTVFRIVTAKGDAPILSAPAEGQYLATRQALLAWQEPAIGTTLRRYVEVATDPAFTQVVVRDSSATAAHLRTPPLTPVQRYYWRVRLRTTPLATGTTGALSGWSATGTFTAGAAVGLDAALPLPAVLTLRAPAPNPARGPVSVTYGLPAAGPVRLHLYDLLGRAVVGVDAGTREAGWHRATLETAGLAPGLYVVRIEAGGAHATRTVVVVR